jgi:hypothetical protein
MTTTTKRERENLLEVSIQGDGVPTLQLQKDGYAIVNNPRPTCLNVSFVKFVMEPK